MSGLFGGGDGGVDIPTKTAENVRRTAKPVDRGTEESRRRRRRQAAGTRPLGPPQLGIPGLLGVSNRDNTGALRV